MWPKFPGRNDLRTEEFIAEICNGKLQFSFSEFLGMHFKGLNAFAKCFETLQHMRKTGKHDYRSSAFFGKSLTLSWRSFLLYKKQSIDLQRKSMD